MIVSLLVFLPQVQQTSEGMDAKVRYVRGMRTVRTNTVQRANAQRNLF